MGDIRLRRPALWSAGASEARPRFGSLDVGRFRPAKSAVAAALCRRTPKVLRVAYPQDSAVSARPAGEPTKRFLVVRRRIQVEIQSGIVQLAQTQGGRVL